MRLAIAGALALPLLAGTHTKRQAARPPAPHVVVHPAPPFPMLPRVGRVRVEAARDHVVVVEDVDLPRGDWRSGDLRPYVAFGAPGTPIAVDAHLLAAPAGETEPRVDEGGEPLPVEPEVRHTSSSELLLGRPNMAGLVVRVHEAALRHAFAGSDLAVLRLRSLLAPPSADASGARDVVVRLGIEGGLPLTLDEVQVVSLEPGAPITRAEASLCGREADAHPLAVSVLPRSAATRPPVTGAVAPPMAVRHASDDLCIRWWAAR